jgi:GGDEF domain-containing protein
VTGLPEGKPVDDGLQRILVQSEWSIVTIRIDGLDTFRAAHGFPAADDILQAVGSTLQNAAASQLKVGAVVGHLAFDEYIILSDMPSLLEFSKSVAENLNQTAQDIHPAPDKADTPALTFQFRCLSSADGTFPSLDALQDALEQTPYRTL